VLGLRHGDDIVLSKGGHDLVMHVPSQVKTMFWLFAEADDANTFR
jgi:hypothetical protein